MGVEGSVEVEEVGARFCCGGGAYMAFSVEVKALPLVWGGGGRVEVFDGDGTAPGCGGGGLASWEGCWLVVVLVGCK